MAYVLSFNLIGLCVLVHLFYKINIDFVFLKDNFWRNLLIGVSLFNYVTLLEIFLSGFYNFLRGRSHQSITQAYI